MLRRHRARLPMAASIAIPAAAAALLVLVLSPAGPQEGATGGPPALIPAKRLAELADLPGGRAERPSPGLHVLEAVSAGALRPARPDRIAIPQAGVDARVQPVSARGDAVEVPPVDRAGWFAAGPRPGEPGHAVLIGHRDGVDDPAVFSEALSLARGARVVVTDRRGVRHPYRVVGTTAVAKERFPANAVYGRSRRPVLVLVTCGGDYHPDTGYEDNVLVYARAA